MNPAVFFLLVPFGFLFLAAFIMITSYLVGGINLFLKGRAEKNSVKIRSGRITLVNSIAWLLLLLAAAYFVFIEFLGLDAFL